MENKFETSRSYHGSSAKTVVVIADTHADSLADLPPRLLSEIRTADYLIHLGDFTSLDLLNELEHMSNFYGILGNHDHPDLHTRLNKIGEVEISGKKLGLIHALVNPVTGRLRMKRSFQNKNHCVNAILYGHSHLPTARFDNGIFFFNPGSVAGKFPASVKSFGKLTIDGTISSEIIILEPRGTLGPLLNIPCAVARKMVRAAEAML